MYRLQAYIACSADMNYDLHYSADILAFSHGLKFHLAANHGVSYVGVRTLVGDMQR